MAEPLIAEPLGLFDGSGVSDGSACTIVTTVEKAEEMGYRDFVSVKALQLSLSNGTEVGHDSWDFDNFITTEIAAKRAYAEAGVKNPREEIRLQRRAKIALGSRGSEEEGFHDPEIQEVHDSVAIQVRVGVVSEEH